MLMTVVMVRMPVVVMVVGVIVMRVLVFLLGLFLNDLVGFEQSNAQQQGQGDIPFDRMQEASIGFDLAEHPFQLFEAFWRNQITFVQHQDVAVEHLSSPTSVSRISSPKFSASITVMIESRRVSLRRSLPRNVIATGSGSASPVVSTTR